MITHVAQHFVLYHSEKEFAMFVINYVSAIHVVY